MPKRTAVNETDGKSSSSKRKRTHMVTGTIKKCDLNNQKLKSTQKSRPVNFTTKLNNTNLKSSRAPVQGVIIKNSSKHPTNERFLEFRSKKQKAFENFENSVGKMSGIPDFDATIRKSFERLKLKRSKYVGSKCRSPKIRYMVLKHLVEMSVQRKDTKCMIHVEDLNLTINKRQLLCPMTVISARFNDLYPEYSICHNSFRKIFKLINDKEESGRKSLFRKQMTGKKSDIVCGKCVKMEWMLKAVNKDVYEILALSHNLKATISDYTEMRKLNNRENLVRFKKIEHGISSWIAGAMFDCRKNMYRFRSLETILVGDEPREVPVWLDLSAVDYAWLLLHRIIGCGDSGFKKVVPHSCSQSGFGLHQLLLTDFQKVFRKVSRPEFTRQLRTWGDYATEKASKY